MPEEQPIKGERWTKSAVKLLEDLGWKPCGDIRVDIPCTLHGKDEHGVDAFLTYYDPYQKRDIGIIVETKYYAWKSVTPSNLQEWIDDLIEKLDCAPLQREFQDLLNFDNAFVDTGVLMVWSHDEFDKAAFEKKLDQVKIAKKRKSLRIIVLHNEDILKLYSVLNAISNISGSLDKKTERFDIYYPSYKKSDSYRNPHFLSLEYFKSKFIFGKMTRMEMERDGGTHPINHAVVFYFDKPSRDCLDYMHLCLRQFQLTEDQIDIHYYGNVEEYRSPIVQFKRDHSEKGAKRIEFEPISRIRDVPLRPEV